MPEQIVPLPPEHVAAREASPDGRHVENGHSGGKRPAGLRIAIRRTTPRIPVPGPIVAHRHHDLLITVAGTPGATAETPLPAHQGKIGAKDIHGPEDRGLAGGIVPNEQVHTLIAVKAETVIVISLAQRRQARDLNPSHVHEEAP